MRNLARLHTSLFALDAEEAGEPSPHTALTVDAATSTAYALGRSGRLTSVNVASNPGQVRAWGGRSALCPRAVWS